MKMILLVFDAFANLNGIFEPAKKKEKQPADGNGAREKVKVTQRL